MLLDSAASCSATRRLTLAVENSTVLTATDRPCQLPLYTVPKPPLATTSVTISWLSSISPARSTLSLGPGGVG